MPILVVVPCGVVAEVYAARGFFYHRTEGGAWIGLVSNTYVRLRLVSLSFGRPLGKHASITLTTTSGL